MKSSLLPPILEAATVAMCAYVLVRVLTVFHTYIQIDSG